MTRAASSLPFVVIAHQSAIPHYRVSFYNLLAEVSAGRYDFGVVYDPEQQRKSSDFKEELSTDFQFKTLPVRTRRLGFGGRKLIWQNVPRYVHIADLLITDTHLSNGGYWTAAFARPAKCLWVLWGHCGNRNLVDPNPVQRLIAQGKLHYIKQADAVFAYTAGEKDQYAKLGIARERIWVLNNTIDLEKQRAIALEQKPQRAQIRQMLNFADDEVVFLMVGRLISGRRADFLVRAFELLQKRRAAARLKLIIIGATDPETTATFQRPNVQVVSAISDAVELGKYLTAADMYVIPGMIGLAPLQAIAHELPVAGFALKSHGPEIEYLNSQNAELLHEATTPEEFAEYLQRRAEQLLPRWDSSRYDSISHLTLKAMVERFDEGVSKLLNV